jgi:dienelactone hydrolase
VLPLNKAEIEEQAKKLLFHTPFHYEPMPALRASTTPQLWVLGSDDLEAPSAETASRIKSLIAAGKNFTLAVYPGVEHGMTEYELAPNGDRLSTRYAPGYFRMMADFITNGRIGNDYGNPDITQPKTR